MDILFIIGGNIVCQPHFYDFLLSTLLSDDFGREANRRTVHLATCGTPDLVSSVQI